MTSRILPLLALLTALTTPVSAREAGIFYSPCERGPLPNSNLINYEQTRFVLFLTEVRPGIPIDVAHAIASELCDDMTLVGDSDGLTQRLRSLLSKYGY